MHDAFDDWTAVCYWAMTTREEYGRLAEMLIYNREEELKRTWMLTYRRMKELERTAEGRD